MFQHEVLDRIADAAASIQDEEINSISERRLTPAATKTLRDTGVMRLVQPARYGGFEADARVFSQALFELGRLSSSAGWVTGVVGIHSWHLGLYDDRAQREVWGDDPDTWISSSYGPAGRAVAVPGGYRLSGRWGFSSGSDQCTWVFVGGMADEGDGGAPKYRHFLLPLSDYQVVDVWNTSGLAGTGSNDILIEDAFVPDYRTMDVEDLYRLDCPGREVNTGPLFSIPWYSIFLNAVVVPIVGMARRAVDEAVAPLRERRSADSAWSPLPLTHARLAQSDSEADLAMLVLQHNLGDIIASVAAGQPVTMEQRHRSKRDHVMAVSLAVAAADGAYLSGGPRSIQATSVLQQVWRDVHAGQHHAMNVPDLIMPAVGDFLTGGVVSYPV
ncbi:flavin-dependent monooxygenase [Nocardioides sp. W7]|uniref:flavin-dependent monooxygenase n=1 Tax=Nocardioides sp. W7 TaxID=2931390 RepID=UPI001FD5ABED|nr:flavin-dependent monooxygenase [Nocardioides sp. W7]